MRIFLFIISILSCIPAYSQILKGRITDTKNEPLPFANIWIAGTTNGVMSNDDGHFELPVKSGNRNDTLVFAFVGYETQKAAINTLDTDKELHIRLKEKTMSLQEVIVVAHRPISEEFTVQKLNQLDIYQNPTANADPLKAIVMLPASTTTDESANPSLRGSAADRTRVIVNGVPVYNPAKFSSLDNIGSFSIFNTHIVRNEYVYASNPPLSYGNSTAGIIEIETATKLNQNTNEVSASLGSAGFMFSRKLKSPDNFVQFYGNCQYGGLLVALNSGRIPRLNNYTVADLGLNLHLKLGEYAAANLYSYGIDERSDYHLHLYTYEDDVKKTKQRVFNVLSFRWQKGRHLIAMNHGNDFSKESTPFGNMNFRPRSAQFYTSASYKHIWDKFNIQAGASHEIARYNTNNSILPRHFYAFSPASPSIVCDSLVKKESLETYAYAKWDISKRLIVSGGVRVNIPVTGEASYLSRQFSVKYYCSARGSLLLAAGKYNGRSVPNYYNLEYAPQTATHYSLDYTWQSEQTAVQAAVYYKTETGDYTTNYVDQSDRREIFGTEIYAEQTVKRWFKFSGSYTYLHSTQHTGDRQFKSYNNMPYIFKATVSYQRMSIGTFAFSYTSRPGLWITPITGGVFHPEAGCFAPVFGDINSQRMGAYNRLDFTANKIFIAGKCSIITYLAINNILNIHNDRDRVYSSDYGTHSYDFYNGRLFYFGVMVGW